MLNRIGDNAPVMTDCTPEKSSAPALNPDPENVKIRKEPDLRFHVITASGVN
jgi:hypothetical protein